MAAVGAVVIEGGRDERERTPSEVLRLPIPRRSPNHAGLAFRRIGASQLAAKSAAERGIVELDDLAARLEHATEKRNDVVNGEWIHVPVHVGNLPTGGAEKLHPRVATPVCNGTRASAAARGVTRRRY